MKLVRIDNESNNGHIMINAENIIYISYFKASNISNRSVEKQAYAQVYFSEGRASIILNKDQYKKLMEGATGLIMTEE